MEFWGFIFTKEEEIRDFFNPYGYQINNENFINTDKIKKYKIGNNWIFYSNYDCLKTINLKEYIKRSTKFAKILYSSDQQILKFDYIENGRFKKQIILDKGELKNIKGYENYFKNIPIEDLFTQLIEYHFGLHSDFLNPKPNYFINENKQDFKLKTSDFLSVMFYFQGSIKLTLFPILFILLIRIIYEALINGTLNSAPVGVYVLFLLYISFAIYLCWEISNGVINYFSIKNRVLNDDEITLPNIV